jgi:hypothetical protein
MKQTTIILILVALCLMVLPAAAVIQEVTVKGTVSALDQQDNTFTIADPLEYGCDYGTGGTPVCTYRAMTQASLTGTVPTASAFTVFKVGDPVIATSLGGVGGSWITLAKLFGPEAADAYVIDIIGDPSTVTAPLAGNYALDLATTPDCNTCSGTTCKATTADVKIMDGSTMLKEQTLKPLQTMMYNGRNDGSSIEVSFVKGESPTTTCAGRTGMTGPQPVSVYIVHVVPPIGMTTHAPVTATTVATAVPTPVPTTTQASASLPLMALGAVGCIAALAICRKQ